MATQTEDIAGLVQSVIRPLIDHEDDLVIDARETEMVPSSWKFA